MRSELENGMEDIRNILAEMKIESITEEAASDFMKSQKIGRNSYCWKRNVVGAKGRLYFGGTLFYDHNKDDFRLYDPASEKP